MIFDESVNGQVIGQIKVSGRLFYDGREQCQRVFADSEQELHQVLMNQLDSIKADCGESFRMIYPENLWELRIDLPGRGNKPTVSKRPIRPANTWWTEVYGRGKHKQEG